MALKKNLLDRPLTVYFVKSVKLLSIYTAVSLPSWSQFVLYITYIEQSFSSAYGNLTVRSLLDTREQFLNEFQFSDPYATVRASTIFKADVFSSGWLNHYI